MAKPNSVHIAPPKRRLFLYRTAIALACTVGMAGLAALPISSQEIPITEQLAQAESKLNGRVDEKGSVEQRISNLETKLFGKKSKGDMSSRLQKIWKALGASPQSSSTTAGSPSASDGSAALNTADTTLHIERSSSTSLVEARKDAGGPSAVQSGMPTETSAGQSGMPTGTSAVQSGMPTGTSAVQSGMPTGTSAVQSGMPTGASAVQSGMATGQKTAESGDTRPGDSETSTRMPHGMSAFGLTGTHNPTIQTEPLQPIGAPHMASGAGSSAAPPWTAALNGNGLSERDRAIAIAAPIDTTQTPDQQSKMLHVGVSKTEAATPAKENLQSLSDADLLRRAKQLLSENRLVEARQILDYLVDRNMKCTEGYLLLGDISAHTGNSVDALRNYWLARNLDPANLILQNRVKGAESVIKSKVRTYHADSNYFPTPYDVRSVVNEGVRLWGLGCPEQASLMFEHATKMDPNNVNAYFNLGAVAEWQGKYPEALNDYLHASACLNHQGPYPWLGTSGRPTTTTDVRHLLSGVARSLGVPVLPMPMQKAPPTPQYNQGAPYLSGGEDTTDIHMDVGQAIEDVRRKMQLNVAQMNIPTLPINQNFHTDTCDRCRILRTKAMGPD